MMCNRRSEDEYLIIYQSAFGYMDHHIKEEDERKNQFELTFIADNEWCKVWYCILEQLDFPSKNEVVVTLFIRNVCTERNEQTNKEV